MTSSELQFAVIKDELTAMVDDIIRQFLSAMVFLMKSSKLYTNNKEDSNSSAPALSSKKDMLQ